MLRRGTQHAQTMLAAHHMMRGARLTMNGSGRRAFTTTVAVATAQVSAAGFYGAARTASRHGSCWARAAAAAAVAAGATVTAHIGLVQPALAQPITQNQPLAARCDKILEPSARAEHHTQCVRRNDCCCLQRQPEPERSYDVAGTEWC